MVKKIDKVTLAERPAKSEVRRRWLVPLAVVVLFAAGVLHFARLQWQHLPASERVNNGAQPTFFAPYIVPSFNFSEDFYLYHVRAKRIATRGWTDSLFYSRPEATPSYSAPIQVALSRVAFFTGGRPLGYAVYMFVVIAAAWMSLYAAARCWLPAQFRSASILAAVLLTVLFESLTHFVELPEATFGAWPVFRGLRMSTMSWTNPLMVATLICTTSLAFDRRYFGTRIAMLMLMLLLLAGADNWAFCIAWSATGLTAAWIGMTAIVQRYRAGTPMGSSIAVSLGLLTVSAAMLLLHQTVNGSMTGDMLTRAGFGDAWSEALRPQERVARVREWFVAEALLPLVIVLIGSLFALVPNFRSRLPLRFALRKGDIAATQLMLLALLPLVATLVMYQLLKRMGMEPFLRNQLYWRLNFFFLFVFALSTLEWWRQAFTACLAWWSERSDAASTAAGQRLEERPAADPLIHRVRWTLCPKSWGSVVAIGLAVLFVFHTYKINSFVTNVAGRHFFLTADAENLQGWLQDFERQQGQFDLATASLELNYLAAFWTNADLLLPSGFPYHNAASNEEIHERTLQVLRLYHATRESWRNFTEPVPGRFQEAWMESRVASSGAAYLYHLYHRLVALNNASTPKWKAVERHRLTDELDGRKTINNSHRAADVPRPKVILVDEVSRALGNPDLAGYDLAFSSGEIEAWVRYDAVGATTKGDRVARNESGRTVGNDAVN